MAAPLLSVRAFTPALELPRTPAGRRGDSSPLLAVEHAASSLTWAARPSQGGSDLQVKTKQISIVAFGHCSAPDAYLRLTT